MAGRLAGKVAIVAGAGSRGPGLGNGKAASILFAREGARVLCVDHVLERAEETVARIRSDGGEAAPFAADVTRSDQCAAMVDEAVRRWGTVEVLHHNVGAESRRDLLETSDEEWNRVLGIDLTSVFLTTKAVAPLMMGRGRGSIVCVSSIAAFRGHGRTAYAAAKAGIIGLVRSVAVQLGPKGVRINAIAPGTVRTPMVEALGPERLARRLAATPLGTEGTGWDVGWAAVFLASDESRWITGQTLVVDAGLTLTTR